MNEGLVAYMKGDTATAIRLVKQAEQRGLKQAGRQLQEFAKLKLEK